MRSPSTLAVRAAQSAAVLALASPVLWCGPAPEAAASVPESASVPFCGRRGSADFPIDARLYGGPARYARGGGWRAWHLELSNTTGAECRAIHPIAILVDRGHALRPRHIRMEFLDPDEGGRWRPVTFEITDEDENIGVFDVPFQGFTVPAHGSVKVAVRSRFTGAAPTGPVTANVITMQRRADDGDWVGQSDDYDFSVEGARDARGAGAEETGETGEREGARTGAPRTDGPPADREPGADQRTGADGRTVGTREEASGGTGPRGEGSSRDHLPPELAATGRGAVLLGLAVVSGALVLTGTALVVKARRLRR
ncbi:hypothetical protein AB0H07_25680 [Streptomyces sp. NPDC021354]|uniref:hypothetical protein n=1 Tax=Streptomyces sp. NPDC021354 TaxID=3154793 RepID=UPI003407BD4A